MAVPQMHPGKPPGVERSVCGTSFKGVVSRMGRVRVML